MCTWPPREWSIIDTDADEILLDEMHVRYIGALDIDWRPATGVWGGPTPRGDIIAAFFFEKQPTPETVVQEINPDRSAGRERDRVFRDGDHHTFERHMLCGVVLTPERARSIGEWLIGKAEFIEQMQHDAAQAADDEESDA